MGTYTTNYNLFMPSIGEQGWGTLVNGNFSTIDTTMKGLNNRMGTAETNITSLTTRMGTAETTITSNKSRIGTLETETDAFDSRITALENTIPEEGVIGANSVTANVLYLPFSFSYAVKVLESNTQNITLSSKNWSYPNTTVTYTVSNLGKYISNVIRPNNVSKYNVHINCASYSQVVASMILKLNDVQVYSSGETYNAISYNFSDLDGSDTLSMYFSVCYKGDGASDTRSRTAVISIDPLGI